MNAIGLIPLCGTASRMKGIPKFLLPCKIDYTLLDNAIDILVKNNINKIAIGVSPLNDIILSTQKLDSNIVKKQVFETKTMAETVYNLILQNYNQNEFFVLVMPDTFFILKNELSEMMSLLQNGAELVVIVWKIKDYQIGKLGQCLIENGNIVSVRDKDKNCDYPYFWGVLGWNSSMNKYIDPEWATIGQLINKAIELGITVKAIVADSDYYDCGTFSEYFEMAKNNN